MTCERNTVKFADFLVNLSYSLNNMNSDNNIVIIVISSSRSRSSMCI